MDQEQMNNTPHETVESGRKRGKKTAPDASNASNASSKKKPAADTPVSRADSLSFEAAAARLEEIVKVLEGGALSLEESLSLYEEGVALVRRCTGELDRAEQRVKVLRRAADGNIETADFKAAEDI